MYRTEMDSLDKIITELANPLRTEDCVHSWTEESRVAILKYFQETRSEIKAGNKCPAIKGLVRGLDAWGISSGTLWEQCMAVNHKLRVAGHAE
ncbi:hypothetical protein HXX02_17120 [Microbulbifer elongatus]|uniref:Uncharacterized protein n=1 Tax=Microbulbifer elongatus TaxID=86173 RepID=A0ABT1P4W9_9GAMM|nr:hypothetical protein [Microbulbifer elongatus]MCQ3831157.1 hypothetical protein [Microbulbifer elongatus]